MSTTRNTETREPRRETPTRTPGIDKPNKLRSVVLTDWDAVKHLPSPEDVWRWGETSMQHKTLYNFKDEGLIKPAGPERAKYWRTTETLWRYVNKTALDGESVGSLIRYSERLDTPERER